MKKLFFYLRVSKQDAGKQGTNRLRVGPYYGLRLEPTRLDALIRFKIKGRERLRWIRVATTVKQKVPPMFLPTNGTAVFLTEKAKKITEWEFHDPQHPDETIRVASIEL